MFKFKIRSFNNFFSFFIRGLSSNVGSNQNKGQKARKRAAFDGTATLLDPITDLSLITYLVHNLSTEHVLHILNSKKISYDTLTGIAGVKRAQPRLYRERITTALINYYRSRT